MPHLASLLGFALVSLGLVLTPGPNMIYLLNPKIAMLYLALLPQFIDPAQRSVLTQSLALGSIQIAISVSVNAMIALAAGSIAVFLGTRPTWLLLQRWLMGTVLAALALRLAFEARRGGGLPLPQALAFRPPPGPADPQFRGPALVRAH